MASSSSDDTTGLQSGRPSQVYIDDPTSAPTVLEAKRFLSRVAKKVPAVRLKSKEGAEMSIGAGGCDMSKNDWTNLKKNGHIFWILLVRD